MKITDHIASAKGRTLLSFEILPPLKGGSMQGIFKILDPLMEFRPPFVDVTYHREEYVYKKRESGYFEKTSIRKRPGTVGICASIMHHYGIDAVPHLTCGGFTREETENALIDLQFLGIQNVLALRGDARKFEASFVPDPDGHHYAVELVEQIANLNKGSFLDDSITSSAGFDFCIGVAGYPEKHFEAPSLRTDLQQLKAKVAAGADYVVTQMFFDNAHYFRFVELCRAEGITVPIIPGLKPVTSRKQLASIPRSFFVNFPDTLLEEINSAKDDAAVKQIGIEWCIEQSRELKAAGVEVLHYYTMGDTPTFMKVGKELA